MILLNVRFGSTHFMWSKGHLPHLYKNPFQRPTWKNIRRGDAGKYWFAVYEPFRWKTERVAK